MFRISFMVEDRRLPEVLRLLVVGDLAGKVVNMEAPQLVTLEGSVKANVGEVHQASNGEAKHGNSRVDWAKFPLPKVGATFDGVDFSAMLEGAGLVKGTSYWAFSKLEGLHRIKCVERRRGNPRGNLYKVVG